MKKLAIIIFMLSVLLLVVQSNPVPEPESEKTMQEKAQEMYDAMKQKAQEMLDSMHETVNKAMDSAREKWQEMTDSSKSPTVAESEQMGRDWVEAGKNFISNIMGGGDSTTVDPLAPAAI